MDGPLNPSTPRSFYFPIYSRDVSPVLRLVRQKKHHRSSAPRTPRRAAPVVDKENFRVTQRCLSGRQPKRKKPANWERHCIFSEHATETTSSLPCTEHDLALTEPAEELVDLQEESIELKRPFGRRSESDTRRRSCSPT